MRKKFYNADVQRFVKKHGIIIRRIRIVEDIGRREIQSYTEEQQCGRECLCSTAITKDWTCYRVLCRITRSNASIGVRPVDDMSVIAEKLLATVYNQIKIAGPKKFKVDDSVRVSKYKTIWKGLHTKLDYRGV